MSLNHIPAAARNTAADQGWDNDIVVLHLLSFIGQNVADADARLAEHFRALADEENANIAMLDPDHA